MARWADDPGAPADEDGGPTYTLPARYYTDPAVLAAEREQLFARSWQYVGDAGRLTEPGDFLAREVAGAGIVLVRDDGGELRGFHNVCAHRGSRIVDAETGCRRRLQCPYHGWSYRLDGSLLAAPDFPEDALDPEADGLRSVRVETLGPMAFASLSDDPAPLSETMGDVRAELAPYAIDEFARVRTVEYPVECNWKVYVDNYLECDHCDLNHPSFVDSLAMDDYEIAAAEDHVAQYGAIHRDSDMDSPYDDRVDPSVAGRYFSAWVWPNVTIDVTPRSLEVARVRPDDHDRTTVVVDYYNREGAVTDAWEEGFAFSSQVMREDVALCERQHAGLAGGTFEQGRLGPAEHGVHRFQTLVRERLDV